MEIGKRERKNYLCPCVYVRVHVFPLNSCNGFAMAPSMYYTPRAEAICLFRRNSKWFASHCIWILYSWHCAGGPLPTGFSRTVAFQLHSGLLSNILNCNPVITINVALKDYLMKAIMLGASIIMAPSSLPPTYLEKFPTVMESEDEHCLPVLNSRLHTRAVKTCCFQCVCAHACTHTHTPQRHE